MRGYLKSFLAVCVSVSIIALVGVRLMDGECRRAREAEALALKTVSESIAVEVGAEIEKAVNGVLMRLSMTDGGKDSLAAFEKTEPLVRDVIVDDRSRESRYRSQKLKGPLPWEKSKERIGWASRGDASFGASVGGLVGWVRFSETLVVCVEIDTLVLLSRVPHMLEKACAVASEKNGDRVVVGEVCDSSGDTLCPGDNEVSSSVRSDRPVGECLPDVILRISWLNAESVVAGSVRTVFLFGACLFGLVLFAFFCGSIQIVKTIRDAKREAQTKSDFVSNVSHELRNPIAGICLNAELLASGIVRDEKKRGRSLEVILKEANRLNAMVGDLLDVSRLEKGVRKFAREEFDVVALTAEVCEEMSHRFAKCGLKVKLPEGGIAVTSDREAVRRIIVNLLDNAAKYAADDGEVEVSVLLHERSCVIRVRDEGPGIPTDMKRRVFERFVRVDDGLTRSRGGWGLGLALSAEFARGIGGALALVGKSGRGACFELSVPVKGEV